jgi:hypothetical protein
LLERGLLASAEAGQLSLGEPAAFGKAGHIRRPKSEQTGNLLKKELASASACAYNAQYEKGTDQLSLAPGLVPINSVRMNRPVYFRKHWVGIVSVVLGAAALGLVIVATMLEEEAVEQDASSRDAQITFQIGKSKLSITRKNDAAEQPVPSTPAEQKRTYGTVFRYSSLGLALLGLVAAPIAWTKQRDKVFGIFGAAIPVLAIGWQHVAAGITLGVACVVVFVILAAIGSYSS